MRSETSEKKEFALPAEQILQTASGGGNILFESGGEFVLPDYLPKVQKVLRLEANVLPPAKYMSGSEAQMSGSVLHSLIYLGEDGETSATVLPSKYEFSIPTAGLASPEVEASVLVDSLTYRLSAPRKINIRTRLCAKPQVFAAEDIAPKQSPEKIVGLHTLGGELDGVFTRFVKLPDTEVADTIDAGGAELRPIWCGATAAVTDVRPTQDGATLRGDVYAKVLVIDGETPKMLQKKIPFEERVDCELQKGASVTARADVISTEAGREQDGGNLYVETVVGLTCRIDEARRIPATLDAFSEIADGEVSLRAVQTEKPVFARCGVYGAGGSVPRVGAGAAEATGVLDTSGAVSVDDVRAEDGRITVSGRCTLNSIYTTADGESAGDCTFPFKITLDAETPDGTTATAFARLAAARARLDGDNLVCDADIFLCVRASLRGEREIVSAIDFTAAKPREKSAYPLSVVYPHGDSLWAVAKANRVSPARLAEINHLTADAAAWRDADLLAGKNALMIEF